MIESIHIKNVATYGKTSEVMNDLSKWNFIFGSNGSGKTTITRVIANESDFPTCEVKWKGGTRLEPMVYNRDFVTHNFNQSTELKGIFTLGEKNVATLEKIVAVRGDLNTITKKIESLSLQLNGVNGLGGKKAELATLEDLFKNKCWSAFSKYKSKLDQAFEGVRNSKDNFRDKVLRERNNHAELKSLAELEERAKTIFGLAPVVEQSIATINAVAVIAHESNHILKKRVLGKSDVDIAAMIKKLGNSDWVREGRTFFAENDSICPFCQQTTEEAFAKSLNEYFDDAFEADSNAIEELITKYKSDSERLQQQVASIIANPSKLLDVEKLKAEKELLDSKITINIQKLASKKKEPSQIIELESITNIVSTIEALISTANTYVTTHNKTVTNLTQEKRILTAQVWKYLLEKELKIDLADYDVKKAALEKAIEGLTTSLSTETASKKAKDKEIQNLEKDTTSIQPTIDEINKLLASFGFRGFSLAKADNGKSYILIRKDSSDAKESLSEGEKTFVTFLYFYHLLKGGHSESGTTSDRIVVFDDPVSSLDSDILFVVSSLIKGLFDEVKSGQGQIKQVFVFTHNVYFHKEVTFQPKRDKKKKLNDESFWIVRKPDLFSKLKKYDLNPIKTSYELLWAQVREAERSKLTIQNTLRRILENYFKILGGIDPDQICEHFEGKDKFICKSLFSWVNDGSHSAFDDLYESIDDTVVEAYLSVFKTIFVREGHLAHYEMMMGETEVNMDGAVA
ncbi:AAA family ATPase [Nitrosomonas ureae]|uniref:Wobble nucleotide-excising tRNase n=1 Tax=Nitrosomonas ureae TaxID=44577 RepID=A0A286ALM3_9PROT|nr:AAA family ATPase [Nitrosomonas ureae]SOD22803.1 Wobble nucleotide-excising tRNase [Nitrosomonas ureae]